MRELTRSLDLIIDLSVDAIVAGFGAAAEVQQAARAKGEGLREAAALHDLFGPRLSVLAAALSGEVERRATPRYASALRHPRYGREALIDELTDAEVAMNAAIAAASRPPTPAEALGLALAVIRVRAIVAAVGTHCFADPAVKGAASHPTPRRRPITAADVDPALAQALLALAEHGAERDARLEAMRRLEGSAIDRNGAVSKVVALAERPDGRALVEQMAATLRAAGVMLDPTDPEAGNDGLAADAPSAPPAGEHHHRVSVSPARSPPTTERRSIAEIMRSRSAGRPA